MLVVITFYYPQWVLGAGRLSSLAVGGGGLVGHFMGGKVIFKDIIGFGGVILRCESINRGGHFYKFYESSKQAVTIKRKLIECRSHE